VPQVLILHLQKSGSEEQMDLKYRIFWSKNECLLLVIWKLCEVLQLVTEASLKLKVEKNLNFICSLTH
jgi:hypothetical protein